MLDEWMESLRAEWREFDVSLVELLAEGKLVRREAFTTAEEALNTL